MGKGKKERSKKNKIKKETREPIKRKLEGKKQCFQTHQIVEANGRIINKFPIISYTLEHPRQSDKSDMYEKIFK